MLRRKNIFRQYKKTTTIIFLLIFLVVLNFLGKNFLQTFLFNIAQPFQKVFYTQTENFSNFIGVFRNINQLKKDNERLYQENWELLSAKNQLEQIKKENEFLRKELDLLPRNKYFLENAEIIGRDYETNNWLLINKGSQQGVKEGQPVILAEGIFLGKVKKTFLNSAQIILISNSKSGISVEDRNTGAKGIARGAYGLGVYLDMVMPTEAIKEGDEVVTAASNQIPQGLLLGKITNIHLSNDGLVQQADIILPYDLSKIHFVSVIKKEKINASNNP